MDQGPKHKSLNKKLLVENIHDFRVDKDFLSRTQKAQSMRKKLMGVLHQN